MVARRDDRLTINFHAESWIRHALIRKLFTGDYHKEIARIRAQDVFATLVQTLFSPGMPGGSGRSNAPSGMPDTAEPGYVQVPAAQALLGLAEQGSFMGEPYA